MRLYKDKLEGYGRITLKRANTKVGHYFLEFTVANPLVIEHIYRRHQMKDMIVLDLSKDTT